MVPVGIRIQEEEGSSSKKITPAESLKKEVDSPNGEYIESEINEKFERISSAWKEEIKKEVLEELKKEMNEKFEEFKKSYEDNFANSFLEENMMDIGGHGQSLESEQN